MMVCLLIHFTTLFDVLAQIGEEEQTPQNSQDTILGRPSTQSMVELIDPAQRQQFGCGQVIKGVITLRSHLTCEEDGLIVGADNTIINLNGYSIKGSGANSTKVGIGVSKNNVAIKGPGMITGFQAGILATGASQIKISSLILQDNEIGVFMVGSDNAEVHENLMKNNTIALVSHSTRNINLESNMMNTNVLAGVTFVNIEGSNVAMNKIVRSQTGIFFDAQSTRNTAKLNVLSNNTIDVNNGNRLATNVNQNMFSYNLCTIGIPTGTCILN
jgi:parallel beta-helix repeat protein